MKTPQKNLGFTILELLVVISIIGLLASVILASINRARIGAKNVQDIATIQEVGRALHLYMLDSKHLPLSYSDTSVSQGTTDYSDTMSELILRGYYPQIPISNSPDGFRYISYNYDENGKPQAALFSVRLQEPYPANFCMAFSPGDTNGDHMVNSIDLNMLAKSYNTKSNGIPSELGGVYDMYADFNKDGIVNFNDLILLGQNMSCSGSSCAPQDTCYIKVD
jgi:prepilin-type N-terminal cleavage/methylation domain-containing protein